jgi:hypothetical protein
MVSQLYYVLRSRTDGQYLAARPKSPPLGSDQRPPADFLLVFTADYDALSYLNAHAPDLSGQFAVEPVTPSSLKPLLSRWNFQGMGLVQDPRIPQVDFFTRE